MRLKNIYNDNLKLFDKSSSKPSTTTTTTSATATTFIKKKNMASSLLIEGGNANGNNNGNNNNNSNGGSSGSGGGGGGGGVVGSGSGVGSGIGVLNSSSNNSTNTAVVSGNGGCNVTSSTDDNKSAKYSMTNNNNNADADAQSLNDDADIRLKRQTLAQRKQELEMLLNEKSWMLQQIQKQEAQIINGNYEYVNLNDILSNLTRQYRQEQEQQQQQKQLQVQSHHSTGSTAILRRKTATGALGMSSSNSSKENQNIINNNNNNSSSSSNNNHSNSNRKSEVSNRSSEYDNYPVSASLPASSSSCGNLTIDASYNVLQQHQQQVPMKQALNAAKKRTTSTSSATNYGSYLLQIQQQQQQQSLASDQLCLQQYLAEQNYLQQKIASYQQRQQQQQQHLVLQLQQQQHQQQLQNLNIFPHDVISLYSVNSANVATLRHQHVAPQQQPQQSTIVQCDKYYLSPTHQSHSSASGCGFIKSSQNIKRYNSPAASPTIGGMSNAGSTMTLGGVNYDVQQPQHHTTLQHYNHSVAASVPATHQLDAISLAPSYAASMDAVIGGGGGNGNVNVITDNPHSPYHNVHWRSHTNIPITTSPLISPNLTSTSHHHLHQQQPQQQQQHYHSHLGVDIAMKSHSSDMLAHISPTTLFATTSTTSINTLPTMTGGGGGNAVAYYGNTLSTTTTHQQQAKSKPLDEISISSLNGAESQKKHATIKPKQWLESTLDGPIIRSTPTSEFVDHNATRSTHHHHSLHKSSTANAASHAQTHSHSHHHHHHNNNHAHPKHKLSSHSMSVPSSSGGVGSIVGIGEHSGGGTAGAQRHYSMSKHTLNAHRQALQDDSTRYAKLSQSTSYLHSLESSNNETQQHNTPLAYQYLPPKPLQVVVTSQPAPPPRPPPALDKTIAAPVAPALVAAAVASANSNANVNANAAANAANNNNNTIIGPDIRIESPKNMTVVQQATFQPYKEVTKPFEMADFYKYSTKFRQKENTPTTTVGGGNNTTTADSGIE